MNDIIHQALLILLPVTALAVVLMKNLINAIIIYTVLSIVAAVVVFQLRAPDVALSMVVINAVSAAIFLFAVHKTGVEE